MNVAALEQLENDRELFRGARRADAIPGFTLAEPQPHLAIFEQRLPTNQVQPPRVHLRQVRNHPRLRSRPQAQQIFQTRLELNVRNATQEPKSPRLHAFLITRTFSCPTSPLQRAFTASASSKPESHAKAQPAQARRHRTSSFILSAASQRPRSRNASTRFE